MNLHQFPGLTLLFVKIEEHERLASRLGNLYKAVISKHHEIIQSLLQAFKCNVIDITDTTSFITFENPEEATRAAISFQQFINHHQWPNQEKVRIGIGIHYSEIHAKDEEVVDIVNLTSALCEASHGEQILLSQALVDQLKGKQIQDLTIQRIGEFFLPGFKESIMLFQLNVPGLKAKFPLLKTASAAPSIAVLPFYNLNHDSRDDYLGLGIAEEIINSLAKKPGIQVLTRASTFGINPMLKIKDLADVLNASFLLDGTVEKKENNIHINVELIDINSNQEIWASKHVAEMSELIALQDSITNKVISTLSPDTKEAVVTEIQELQTDNIEAYDKYLKGNKFYYQYSQESVQFARRMYQQALQLDHNYALAFCGLANCFSYLYMHHKRTEENLASAIMFSKKAIAINSSLAEAHIANGMALSLQEDFEASEQSFEKAIALDPSLFEAQYQYARMCFNRGDLMAAAKHFEMASRIRQDDYQSLLLNGQCYDSLGLTEKANEARIRGVQIAEEVLELNPGNIRALYMGANGLVALGDPEKSKIGISWLQRALSLEPNDAMLLYNAGCIYALCKMYDKSLICLEKAFDTGLTQKAWYLHDSNLDPLREMPRFQKLINSMTS